MRVSGMLRLMLVPHAWMLSNPVFVHGSKLCLSGFATPQHPWDWWNNFALVCLLLLISCAYTIPLYLGIQCLRSSYHQSIRYILCIRVPNLNLSLRSAFHGTEVKYITCDWKGFAPVSSRIQANTQRPRPTTASEINFPWTLLLLQTYCTCTHLLGLLW